MKRLFTLFERHQSIVYHFTTIENLLRLAKRDKWYCSKADENKNVSHRDKDIATYNNTEDEFFISFSRVKFGGTGFQIRKPVRIHFDLDALQCEKHLNSAPCAYYMDAKSKQDLHKVENEERLFSPKREITGVYKYISQIDVFVEDIESSKKHIDYELLQETFPNIHFCENKDDFDICNDNYEDYISTI